MGHDMVRTASELSCCYTIFEYLELTGSSHCVTCFAGRNDSVNLLLALQANNLLLKFELGPSHCD